MRPDEFIPVAEETGSIITLGNWITAQAAKAAAQWPDDVTMSVNLSPLQIRRLARALRHAGRDAGGRLPPSRLELEITESVFLDSSRTPRSFMHHSPRPACASRSTISAPAIPRSATSTSTRSEDQGRPQLRLGASTRARRATRSSARWPEWAQLSRWRSSPRASRRFEQVRAVSRSGLHARPGLLLQPPVPDYLAGMLLAKEREKIEISRTVEALYPYEILASDW
jgi:hypothetical protein